MKKLVLSLAVAVAACVPNLAANTELAEWQQQARNVTIIRDDWGIAHVYGNTDADAVFGAIYAQAEDDFNRIETNYLNSMGRLAEAEGEGAIWRDLRMKLFIDPDEMKKLYAAAPADLRKLMDAWADGLNYYLATHPAVKPRVITRFEPWMPLTFSEGSIGGDIERVNLTQLQAFYGDTGRRAGGQAGTDDSRFTIHDSPVAAHHDDDEPRGSNGIAIGPSNTINKRALLLINPHTSFFFRSELQMVSEEGLNAYGASTWGQFFIYQGFNDKAGWMHTSSSVDNIDEYLETITRKDGWNFYRHGSEEKPVAQRTVTIPYKTPNGTAERQFVVYRTHHGPIVREMDGKWVAIRIMEEPLKALQQSWGRTKARNLQEYLKVMELHTNSSNNTLFADAEGNFAYLHSNFVPRRDTSFNWARPVDGSNPATDWKGVHSLSESPNAINPKSGWAYNTNNFPYSAAGPDSPKPSDYPRYMDPGSENPRGIHAIRVLKDKKDFTLDGLLAAAFDSYMPSFETSIPPLLKAYDGAPADHPLKAKLREPIELLRTWDYRWSATSIPTSLGVFYSQAGSGRGGRGGRGGETEAAGQESERLLQQLSAAVDRLQADFGSWKTGWGEINRFQRISPEIVHPFDDSKPSIPVMFTSATYGSLASFGAAPRNGSKKWYGTSGNSFVAVVEFGKDSVRARAVSAGGESGDPTSKHFNDQATRYATGNLRTVYFYRNQLKGHTEREYRPGER
ncbi:MAG TPA: penicillin acylase family protein [Gemmatimonadaceae bacterium]